MRIKVARVTAGAGCDEPALDGVLRLGTGDRRFPRRSRIRCLPLAPDLTLRRTRPLVRTFGSGDQPPGDQGCKGERYRGGKAQPAAVELPDRVRLLRRLNRRAAKGPRNRKFFAPLVTREEATLELFPIGSGQPLGRIVVGEVVPHELHTRQELRIAEIGGFELALLAGWDIPQQVLPNLLILKGSTHRIALFFPGSL